MMPMSAFAEFICLAVAIYLWESILWVPLWSTPLRRAHKGWRALKPTAWFATRKAGAMPLRPLLVDRGIAPCQAPLPVADPATGELLVETSPGSIRRVTMPAWEDIRHDGHHLHLGPVKLRQPSRRYATLLGRAKEHGCTPGEAIERAALHVLSPRRAGREWRRWHLAAGPMRWLQTVLTLGFFPGLPLAYMHLDSRMVLGIALWLWLVMLVIAVYLWWLGKRVYPDARGALTMDALLSLLVPFHAMRASEMAAVHAMATTHPIALMLATRDLGNPWLATTARQLRHPLPGRPDAAAHAAATAALVERVLANMGESLARFDHPPYKTEDSSAANYCPRCHALYQDGVGTCADCSGMALEKLG